jgi:SAM-dependent methyltransferase
MTTLQTLHDTARDLTRDDWCAAFIDAAGGSPVTLDLPPFPPEELQRITNSQSNAQTMRGAADFYRIVDEELQSVEVPSPALLDFGAGWGRITRLLLRSRPPQHLTAVDVDARLVEAGAATLPGVSFQQIESGKPLPFADASFGLVIANSVFSHLSEAAQTFHVADIARVLAPGGLFIGTTLAPRRYRAWLDDPAYRDWIVGLLGEPETVLAELAAGQAVHQKAGRWADYGIAILPEGYAERAWSQWFADVRTRTDYIQDVHCARKAV